MFDNMKIRNALTITLISECVNMTVDLTFGNFINKRDDGNSGLTQILTEQEFENQIESIVNVNDFNSKLSYF